ncbi:MAG: response regulator transcription factor [Alphaproteobacteria bacterium]|nr:response regulator transcription factor [Alphaproteobacteria bacterium]
MKIRLISDNTDFLEDLIAQLTRYVDDFLLAENQPDVVVVDENVSMVLQIRASLPTVPIILLTSENVLQTDCLNLVLHKPFLLRDFIDIIRSANNRLDNSVEGELIFNQYKLQPTARKITNLQTNAEIKLTEKEVDILKYLHKSPNQFVSKNDLQVNVWRYNEEVSTHTVETHIYRLRQKLENVGAQQLITTDNGKYKLNTE